MKWEHVRFREKRKTRSFKEKKRCRFLRLCDFTVCAQCTAVIAVLSSTEHCSDIFHLLPLDPISTETFRSHLLFVKVSTQLCHLWAGCLRQAGHISQAVNLQTPTAYPSLSGCEVFIKNIKATSGLVQKASRPTLIVIAANLIQTNSACMYVEEIIANCPVKYENQHSQ